MCQCQFCLFLHGKIKNKKTAQCFMQAHAHQKHFCSQSLHGRNRFYFSLLLFATWFDLRNHISFLICLSCKKITINIQLNHIVLDLASTKYCQEAVWMIFFQFSIYFLLSIFFLLLFSSKWIFYSNENSSPFFFVPFISSVEIMRKEPRT